MGLFSRNFERPGPGVPRDEPRKTGVPRFFELLFRDFFDYVKLSFLFCLTVLPSAAMFVIGALPLLVRFWLLLLGEDPAEVDAQIQVNISILPLLLSLVLAFPIGGVLTACYFNITRFMRDDPSYLWHDFKRKFKENWKQAAPSGIICAGFVYVQLLVWVFVFCQMLTGTYEGGLMWVIIAAMSLLLFAMITPYIFLHHAYIDLGAMKIIKNSFLMSLVRLPKSFMGGLLGSLIWVAFIIFVPFSMLAVPMIPIIFASLSMLLTLTWIWPPFNKHFDIEETLRKKKAEREQLEENEINV